MLHSNHTTSASRFKYLSFNLALVLSLTLSSWSVSAEQSRLSSSLSFTQTLNDIAAVNSDLTDAIEVNEHWSRINFDSVYNNPVVIPDIESFNSSSDGAFMLGIRNADAEGFEVRLERCQQASSMQFPEVVYIAVLESGEYPTSEGAQVEVKQRFLWGQCDLSVQQAAVSH